MRDIDNDELEEDRQERYNKALQRRLDLCGDRTYPSVYAREDIIEAEQERLRINALLQGDMDTPEDEPHHYLAGIVDISEGEE